MTISDALYAQLSASTLLSPLVGGSGVSPATDARIYDTVMQERPTLPAITYQIISGHDEIVLDTDDDPQLAEAVFQVQAFSKSRSEAQQVIEAFRDTMFGLGPLWGDLVVRMSEFARGAVIYDNVNYTYQVPVHISLWHKPST